MAECKFEYVATPSELNTIADILRGAFSFDPQGEDNFLMGVILALENTAKECKE